MKIIFRAILYALGRRKRYCITCHKLTYQWDNELIGWVCNNCGQSNYTRELQKSCDK